MTHYRTNSKMNILHFKEDIALIWNWTMDHIRGSQTQIISLKKFLLRTKVRIFLLECKSWKGESSTDWIWKLEIKYYLNLHFVSNYYQFFYFHFLILFLYYLLFQGFQYLKLLMHLYFLVYLVIIKYSYFFWLNFIFEMVIVIYFLE